MYKRDKFLQIGHTNYLTHFKPHVRKDGEEGKETQDRTWVTGIRDKDVYLVLTIRTTCTQLFQKTLVNFPTFLYLNYLKS